MQILLINSEYPPTGGGASNASANVAAIWVSQGHQVTVLTSCYGGLPDEEMVDGVRIHRIPALRRRIDRSTPVEQVSFLLSAMIHAPRFCKKWLPDVSIAYFGVPSGPSAWLLKKLYPRQGRLAAGL